MNTITDEGPDGTATFSPCRLYRYRLTRMFGIGNVPGRAGFTEKLATFIMLNPSTADAFILDPTIRRCVGYAQREDCTGVCIVNLFAFRSSDPDALSGPVDPYGPCNEHFLRGAIASSDLVIAAWGVPSIRPLGHRSAHLIPLSLAERLHRTLYALKLSKDGHPCHPLYLKKDAPLIPYRLIPRSS